MLQDSGCVAGGLRVWGSPWTPWFHAWAFNAPQADGEAFLAERYAAADADADVLLIHGPPAGYGDRIVSGARVGSSAQLALIDRVSPRLCVFGHIHEDRGAWQHGATDLVNAAAVDVGWQPLADPVVVLDL